MAEQLGISTLNTGHTLENKSFFKLYRRFLKEVNSGIELIMFLTAHCSLHHSFVHMGSIHWGREDLPELSNGLMQEKAGDNELVWEYFLNYINSFFSNIESGNVDIAALGHSGLLVPKSLKQISELMTRLIRENVINDIRKLAIGTVQMHMTSFSGKHSTTFFSTTLNRGLDIGHPSESQYLLKYHMLEKAICELGYEQNARQDWPIIPLTGVFQLLNNDTK